MNFPTFDFTFVLLKYTSTVSFILIAAAVIELNRRIKQNFTQQKLKFPKSELLYTIFGVIKNLGSVLIVVME